MNILKEKSMNDPTRQNQFIIGPIFDDDPDSPTGMNVFDYLYNRSFLAIKHIQFFDIDGRLTHKFIDNDLYIIFNIFKSWYNNQIDLEYKEVYAIEKLYKENPNLLKETILLDISKRTKFANFANIIDNTKITNINHPKYNIRKGLKYD